MLDPDMCNGWEFGKWGLLEISDPGERGLMMDLSRWKADVGGNSQGKHRGQTQEKVQASVTQVSGSAWVPESFSYCSCVSLLFRGLQSINDLGWTSVLVRQWGGVPVPENQCPAQVSWMLEHLNLTPCLDPDFWGTQNPTENPQWLAKLYCDDLA